MSEITTRSATINDLPTLLQFEQGVVTAERPYDPTLKAGPINYYDLKALIASADAEVVVAETGNQVIGSGYALVKTAKAFVDHERYAYLGFMFVPENFRGRGVNKKIIEHLKTWANSKGLVEIRLEVYTENVSAIRAYEKVGFKGLLLEMRMEIEH